MRARICVAATIVAGLTFTCAATLPGILGTGFGVTSADAAGFYTRKRVNGQWITGRFAEEGYGNRHAARGSRRHTVARRQMHRHVRVVERHQRETAPSRRSAQVVTTGALGALAPLDGPSAASVLPAGDPHLSRLHDALQARAREIAFAGAPAPGRVLPDERGSSAPKAATPEVAVPQVAAPQVAVPQVAAPQTPTAAAVSTAALQPRSVSFDFQSGLKTTVFEGDVTVREPFDTMAMKEIASRPPKPLHGAGGPASR